MKIRTIDPKNGYLLAEYEEDSREEIFSKIEKSDQAYQEWKKTNFSQRANLLLKVADILIAGKDKFARLMADEMGKPTAQGKAEIEKSAWVCRYYAENAENQLKDLDIKTEKKRSYVSFRPIGPVLAIMPWNFPFWQVFRFAAPYLMAGNTVMLKHAPGTSGCSIHIEKIFKEAGYPGNVFTNILISPENVPARTPEIIHHPLIKGVTLTGSTGAGIKVAEAAGQVLKKSVLELGGSDPYIILEDADIDKAAEACIASRMGNAGQTCIAAKRLIAVDEIYDDFVRACMEEIKKYKPGNPLDDEFNMGPMARKDLRDGLHAQVEKSIGMGAKLLTGGIIPDREGYYYLPTALENVCKGMPAFDEELFGPVAVFIRAKDETDAIHIANDTEFGLGAAVFTADDERGNRIALEELEAGSCAVNEFVKSDPRLPFGGINGSGYGRELGLYGIQEFVNIKTVCIL